MKRQWKNLVLLTLVVVFAASGCGQRQASKGHVPQEKAASSAPARTVAPPTGNVAPLRVAIPMSGSKDQLLREQAINEVIRQNMQANYVEVETVARTPITSDVGAVEQVGEDLKAEGAPDVLVLSGCCSAKMLAEAGALLPLDKVIADRLPGYESLVYKSAAKGVRWQGSTIGIPRTLDPEMILYNKAHFAAADVEPDPDWNWEEFVAVSQQVSEGARAVFSAADKEGKRIPHGAKDVQAAGAVCYHPNCWLPFLLSNGGGYLAPDEETILVDSQASVGALSWLQAQFSNGRVQGFTARSLTSSLSTASFGPDSLSTLYTLNENGNLYGALPFPKSPYTDRSVTTVSTSMYVVNAYSKSLDLAIDFVVAALSRPAQERVAVETGLVPARKDVLLPSESWFPPKAVLDTVLDDATVLPPSRIGNRYIFQLKFLTLMLGKESAEDLAKKAAKDLRETIDRKDDPEPVRAPDRSTSWFGGSAAAPVKTRQDPPPPDFTGVTVRWLGASRSEVLSLLDAFNAKASETGIYVDLVENDDLEGYTPDGYFRKSLAEGKPVDLITTAGVSVTDLAKDNLLEPLDHYLRFDLPSVPDGGLLNQARYQGKLLEVPLFRIPTLVFVRHDAWERAGFAYPAEGWSWDDFWRWTQKAMDPASDLLGVAMNRFTWETLFYQMGGKLATGPYEPLEPALRMVKQFMATYPEEFWADSFGPSMADLTKGRAVAYVGAANFHDLRTSATLWDPLDTVLESAKLMVLPLPTPSGGLTGTGSSYAKLSVLKDAPHREEAIKFVQWVLSAEASSHLQYLESGRLPAFMYPEAYAELEQYLGPKMQSVLPVPFTSTSETHPRIRELRTTAASYADKYFYGEKGLLETVANMSADLPRVAQGVELAGQGE